jgi:hypothetical protein
MQPTRDPAARRAAYLLGFEAYSKHPEAYAEGDIPFPPGGERTNWTRGFWDAKCGRPVEDVPCRTTST